MSEKSADPGVLVRVVPSGAVPGSPGPDTTIPTSAINAAAAMRMPGRRYHREVASVRSAVRVPFASPEPSAIPIECADSAPAMTVVQFRLRYSRIHRARPLGQSPAMPPRRGFR